MPTILRYVRPFGPIRPCSDPDRADLAQAQSRQRQEQQAQVLRNIRADMMPQGYQQMMMRGQQPNGANMTPQQQLELRKSAMANRQQNA
jgi:hypothetical protein